jgi:hypothetical protein
MPLTRITVDNADSSSTVRVRRTWFGTRQHLYLEVEVGDVGVLNPDRYWAAPVFYDLNERPIRLVELVIQFDQNHEWPGEEHDRVTVAEFLGRIASEGKAPGSVDAPRPEWAATGGEVAVHVPLHERGRGLLSTPHGLGGASALSCRPGVASQA